MRPILTGSPPMVKTIGIVVVVALAATAAMLASASMTATRRRTQIVRQRRKPICLALGPAEFNFHILAFDIAGFAQAFAEGCQPRRFE